MTDEKPERIDPTLIPNWKPKLLEVAMQERLKREEEELRGREELGAFKQEEGAASDATSEVHDDKEENTMTAMTIDKQALRVANTVRYFGLDSRTHETICRSIARLPEEVREFAVERCVFLSVGGAALGQCLPSEIVASADWIIVVEDNDGFLSADMETVVAHEIAHAYRGDRMDDELTADEQETLTRELTRSWGFAGLGADSV